MPGITVKIRNKNLIGSLETYPNLINVMEESIRQKMKKMSGVDLVDFDWDKPWRSTAESDIEFDVAYTVVRDDGLMPRVSGEPEWTKNAADEMREMLENNHLIGYKVAVWFQPQRNAGYSETAN